MPQASLPRNFSEFHDSQYFNSSLWVRDRLDNGNWILRLRLVVYLESFEERKGPPAGYYAEQDMRYGIAQFDRMDWHQWKCQMHDHLESYWADRFWLQCPDDYDGLDVDKTRRPNLKCELKITFTDSPGGAHCRLRVNPKAAWRTNRMNTGMRWGNEWLDHTWLGSRPETTTGLTIQKFIGHLFSWSMHQRQFASQHRHYAIVSSDWGPAPIESGTKREEDTLGPSHSIELWHARPWQLAAAAHTGVDADKWRIKTAFIAPISISPKGIGHAGLTLLKKHESLRLEAYDDSTGKPVPEGEKAAGTLTIGWGHTGPDVKPGQTIDKDAAEALLRKDVAVAENAVNRNVKVALTQNQFDALVVFAFNVGIGAFAGSTLLKVLNQADFEGAKSQFAAWNKTTVGGVKKESKGLGARRAEEAALFGQQY